MVMVPPVVPPLAGVGAAAESAATAGNGAVGLSGFVRAGSDSFWEEDEMPVPPGGSSGRGSGGFTYQGEAYDPLLREAMEVSAETHGDYWEDEMDYAETVSYEVTEKRPVAVARAKVDERRCNSCPPEGKVLPMVRRCSRWSRVTISYQTRICGTYYNPETQQIQEFKYCGVSFDGWKAKLCQFWEAKARYDQFFRADGKKKIWWTGDDSALKQAGRHQAVATVNQPLKIVWIFMQPISARYFSNIFQGMPDIIVRWVP